MSFQVLFRVANNLALLGWLTLIFLPRWRWSARLIAPILIPIVMAIVYIAMVTTGFGRSSGGFSSLSSVQLLFQNPDMVLAGWVHYLAFDLFIGSWEVRDSQRVGIAHYLVAPCLVFTFLFGPAGWLLYLILRAIAVKTLAIEGNPAIADFDGTP